MNLSNFKNLDLYDLGGHTVDTHIRTNLAELRDRLRYGDIDGGNIVGNKRKVTSMFISETSALAAISKTIEKNQPIIQSWISNRDEKQLTIKANFLDKIGIGLAKGTDFKNVYPFYACTVVLKLGYNGNDFEILTAYPSLTREIDMQIQNDKIEFHKRKHSF